MSKKKTIIITVILFIIIISIIGICLIVRNSNNNNKENTNETIEQGKSESVDISNRLSENLLKERQYKQYTYKVVNATYEIDEDSNIRNSIKLEFTNNGEKTETTENIEINFLDIDKNEIAKTQAVLEGTEKDGKIEIIAYSSEEISEAEEVTVNEVSNTENQGNE